MAKLRLKDLFKNKKLEGLSLQVIELAKENQQLRNDLEKQDIRITDLEKGTEVLKKLENDVREALTVHKTNEKYFEQYQKDVVEYFDFNK